MFKLNCTVGEVDMRIVSYTCCKVFHKLALKASMNCLKYHWNEI